MAALTSRLPTFADEECNERRHLLHRKVPATSREPRD